MTRTHNTSVAPASSALDGRISEHTIRVALAGDVGGGAAAANNTAAALTEVPAAGVRRYVTMPDDALRERIRARIRSNELGDTSTCHIMPPQRLNNTVATGLDSLTSLITSQNQCRFSLTMLEQLLGNAPSSAVADERNCAVDKTNRQKKSQITSEKQQTARIDNAQHTPSMSNVIMRYYGDAAKCLKPFSSRKRLLAKRKATARQQLFLLEQLDGTMMIYYPSKLPAIMRLPYNILDDAGTTPANQSGQSKKIRNRQNTTSTQPVQFVTLIFADITGEIIGIIDEASRRCCCMLTEKKEVGGVVQFVASEHGFCTCNADGTLRQRNSWAANNNSKSSRPLLPLKLFCQRITSQILLRFTTTNNNRDLHLIVKFGNELAKVPLYYNTARQVEQPKHCDRNNAVTAANNASPSAALHATSNVGQPLPPYGVDSNEFVASEHRAQRLAASLSLSPPHAAALMVSSVVSSSDDTAASSFAKKSTVSPPTTATSALAVASKNERKCAQSQRNTDISDKLTPGSSSVHAQELMLSRHNEREARRRQQRATANAAVTASDGWLRELDELSGILNRSNALLERCKREAQSGVRPKITAAAAAAANIEQQLSAASDAKPLVANATPVSSSAANKTLWSLPPMLAKTLSAISNKGRHQLSKPGGEGVAATLEVVKQSDMHLRTDVEEKSVTTAKPSDLPPSAATVQPTSLNFAVAGGATLQKPNMASGLLRAAAMPSNVVLGQHETTKVGGVKDASAHGTSSAVASKVKPTISPAAATGGAKPVNAASIDGNSSGSSTPHAMGGGMSVVVPHKNRGRPPAAVRGSSSGVSVITAADNNNKPMNPQILLVDRSASLVRPIASAPAVNSDKKQEKQRNQAASDRRSKSRPEFSVRQPVYSRPLPPGRLVCPAQIRARLLNGKNSNNNGKKPSSESFACTCTRRHLPRLHDVEFDEFMRRVKPDQLIVVAVCLLPPTAAPTRRRQAGAESTAAQQHVVMNTNYCFQQNSAGNTDDEPGRVLLEPRVTPAGLVFAAAIAQHRNSSSSDEQLLLASNHQPNNNSDNISVVPEIAVPEVSLPPHDISINIIGDVQKPTVVAANHITSNKTKRAPKITPVIEEAADSGIPLQVTHGVASALHPTFEKPAPTTAAAGSSLAFGHNNTAAVAAHLPSSGCISDTTTRQVESDRYNGSLVTLGYMYKVVQYNRQRVCFESYHDMARMLAYDYNTAGKDCCHADNDPTCVKPPPNTTNLLAQRYNATPGMVLIFANGGELFFCSYIFNNYSNALADFELELLRQWRRVNQMMTRQHASRPANTDNRTQQQQSKLDVRKKSLPRACTPYARGWCFAHVEPWKYYSGYEQSPCLTTSYLLPYAHAFPMTHEYRKFLAQTLRNKNDDRGKLYSFSLMQKGPSMTHWRLQQQQRTNNARRHDVYRGRPKKLYADNVGDGLDQDAKIDTKHDDPILTIVVNETSSASNRQPEPSRISKP